MSRSATVPTRDHPGVEKYALPAAAPLLPETRQDCWLAERVKHALHATGYGACAMSKSPSMLGP
jgi:hypothetical protein